MLELPEFMILFSFQSTLPRRERQDKYLEHSELKLHFNPRSREGSDSGDYGKRGRTKNFNPRSREGSDLIQSALIPIVFNFNPRSREGSDISAHLNG